MELAPGMHQATGQGDLEILAYLVVYRIAVALQIPCVTCKQFFGAVLPTPFSVIEQHQFLDGVVVDPLVALVAASFFITFEHFYRALVRLDIA